MKVTVKESEEKNLLSIFGLSFFYLAPCLLSFEIVRSILRAYIQIPDLSLSACNFELN